jgi:hypothetical protein
MGQDLEGTGAIAATPVPFPFVKKIMGVNENFKGCQYCGFAVGGITIFRTITQMGERILSYTLHFFSEYINCPMALPVGSIRF